MSDATPDPSYDPAAEVVDICRDLIRMDTTNFGDGQGPGERKAAEHVATLLEEVGIATELWEAEPGRTNVVARWGGDQGEPMLLHGHLDVVPANADDWQLHPFSGEVQDGMVWGRGAVDMKDFDAMLLSTVRARARAGRVPSRPLVLCFTADEEAGGHLGAGPLVEAKREWFEDCTYAVGEVGGFSTTVRGRRMYLVEAAEKGMAWIRLTATGNAGHGSMRHPDNAVTHLAEAVARIGRHEWPVQLTPTMRVLVASVGELAGTEATPDNALQLVEEFGPAARMLGAVLSHTTNPTMLEAGYKVNVVPGQATARIDGRFLPGLQDEFLATLEELVGPHVEVSFDSLQDGLETAYDGAVADAMTASILEEDPGAIVAPYLMSGGTDAKHFTKLGMRAFGFAPLRLPDDLDFTGLFHGVDERVPVDALEFGARVFDRFLGRI
ncbi:Acetylornithine deacetylase/Succinyl-diaminopimelate desuccinylase [Nocardioides scoriae]|uniref:Acetylornithine deacetylase/Succinyl-diaminopimelate desuccinylase n=1 Tax=Nocardioides scoriae TaxID=642780 RepID=A0A1H1NFY2_9ACTN|nr:M20/M25/M40 family metallo-hydrolase [Nocardioides scoriae]SDR97896.1 Acetylornithine deacetylase/Succinyl-diaminopimelate desuccinylase [Nocardioides scoriae]